MIRALLAWVVLVALTSAAPPGVAMPGVAMPRAHSAVPFAQGLAEPAAFTFAPDGRVFYGERHTGEIRILSADGNTDALFFTVPDVVSAGEQGLLGIALHPDYPTTPQVFAYATRSPSGHERNQIVRLTDTAGTGTDMQVLWSSPTESGSYHDGGHIAFGPDGMLYAVVGEAHSPDNAQDLGNDAGKVLRMNPDGSVPSDNPFPGSRIWSYGLRNSFGFAFDPITGRLWESENGPSCNDELNRILKGRNFGWGPNETCATPPAAPRNTNQDGPNPVQPRWFWDPTVAPVGVAFCDGCGLGSRSEGRLFLGEYNTGRILRVRLDDGRRQVTSVGTFYTHGSSVLSLQRAPDGAIYFSDPDGIWRLAS